MRAELLLLFLLLPRAGFAQQQADSLLKKIISAAPQDFQTYKSSVRTGPEFITYHSTVTIEGTSDNYIRNFIPGSVYEALVKDSMTRNKAWKLLKTWKRKMSVLLEPAFTLKKIPFYKFNRGRDYEFTFENHAAAVSVNLAMVYGNADRRPYSVILQVYQDPPLTDS